MAGTRWARIDTAYLRNPKITALSQSATLLHLASILWTAEHLTDGHIPRTALPELGLLSNVSRQWVERRSNELVKAGLWTPSGGDWYIHDFAEMNPQALRAAVETQRAKWRTWQEDHRKQ